MSKINRWSYPSVIEDRCEYPWTINVNGKYTYRNRSKICCVLFDTDREVGHFTICPVDKSKVYGSRWHRDDRCDIEVYRENIGCSSPNWDKRVWDFYITDEFGTIDFLCSDWEKNPWGPFDEDLYLQQELQRIVKDMFRRNKWLTKELK